MTFRSLFRGPLVAACATLLSTSVLIAQDEGGGDEGGGDQDSCSACRDSARAAKDACRDEGGNWWECFGAYHSALRDCLEEGDCVPERPDRPDRPEPCGAECFSTAREASAACRDEGGGFWDCLGAFRDALRSCREEAGCEVRERREVCGSECFGTGRDAFRDCRAGGSDDDGEEGGDGEGDDAAGGGGDDDDPERGSFLECAQVFIETVRGCREEAGCGESNEEDAEEEDDAIEELVFSSIEFLRGDVNDDGVTELTDAVNVLQYLFLGGNAPECMDAADSNDDGAVDMADATSILSSLFLGTGPLPAPSQIAGIDPTEDSLTCGSL
ncbi:MAG: dockerin type I repeat-containing protein [Planctomycetota bacterium]